VTDTIITPNRNGIRKMDMLIINTIDGTVINATNSVIVDVSKLDEQGKALLQEWVEGGNDNDAIELGGTYGTKVEKFTNNELTYSNTMAFSGRALRDEVRERIDMGYTSDEYLLAKDFTDEQFEELGQYILSSDYLWNVFSEEVSSGIRNYTNDILGRKI
jgi:hypothetical protein